MKKLKNCLWMIVVIIFPYLVDVLYSYSRGVAARSYTGAALVPVVLIILFFLTGVLLGTDFFTIRIKSFRLKPERLIFGTVLLVLTVLNYICPYSFYYEHFYCSLLYIWAVFSGYLIITSLFDK